MDLLAVAWDADPVGFVAIGATPIPDEKIHLISAGPPEEVSRLLSELETAGVFSRDRRGCIYSRRMQRDARMSRDAQKTGKIGGLLSADKRMEKAQTLGQNPRPPLRDTPKAPLNLEAEADSEADAEGKSETLPDSPHPSSWRPELSTGAHHPGTGERQGSGSDEPGAIAPSNDLAKALWDLGVGLLVAVGYQERNTRG
jgi:hypothetical protein